MSRLIDQKGLKYFQQRCFKRLMFPTSFKLSLFRFGLERGLVVHLGIGIHVAYVVVADQGHVTKFFNSTKNVVVNPRGVTCVDLK